jgi:hypothetical protein
MLQVMNDSVPQHGEYIREDARMLFLTSFRAGRRVRTSVCLWWFVINSVVKKKE